MTGDLLGRDRAHQHREAIALEFESARAPTRSMTRRMCGHSRRRWRSGSGKHAGIGLHNPPCTAGTQTRAAVGQNQRAYNGTCRGAAGVLCATRQRVFERSAHRLAGEYAAGRIDRQALRRIRRQIPASRVRQPGQQPPRFAQYAGGNPVAGVRGGVIHQRGKRGDAVAGPCVRIKPMHRFIHGFRGRGGLSASANFVCGPQPSSAARAARSARLTISECAAFVAEDVTAQPPAPGRASGFVPAVGNRSGAGDPRRLPAPPSAAPAKRDFGIGSRPRATRRSATSRQDRALIVGAAAHSQAGGLEPRCPLRSPHPRMPRA